MEIALSLSVGLLLWYGFYGIDCVLNGATGGWTIPFRCLWDDIRFNAPGGRARLLRECGGDEKLAAECPGLIYCFFHHVMLPFGPFLFVVSSYF